MRLVAVASSVASSSHWPGRAASRGADERQLALLVSHTLAGLIGFLVFGAYFVFFGGPTAIAVFAAGLFVSPLLIAILMVRTGALAAAHVLSAAQLALIVSLVASMTGGLSSFAVLWLALVPLEAALSGERRGIAVATFLAGASLLGLWVAELGGLLSTPAAMGPGLATLQMLSPLVAVAHAAALALGVERFHARSEAAVRASAARYELLADNASDVILRTTCDGETTFVSGAGERLLGLPSRMLLGRGFLNLLAEADRARVLAAIGRSATQGVEQSLELPLAPLGDGPARDGLWLELRCRPILDPRTATGPVEVVAVVRDITQRKAIELEIADARDAALRANQAKTRFLASVSHELRTPLNSIIGFAELLHRELLIKAREPKHAEYCRIVHESGEHLLSLVNDLIDVTRIEAGGFTIVREPFAPASLIESTSASVRALADKKGLALVIDCPERLPDISADQRAVKQIVLNLLSNAVKFTDKGEVRLTARVSERALAIAVRDTGIGIPPEALARIGNSFFQADGSYAARRDGAGLGLSIVKGLVGLHGGSMTIDSAPGSGTEVTVRLPLDEAAGAGERQQASPVVVSLASRRPPGRGRGGEEPPGRPELAATGT